MQVGAHFTVSINITLFHLSLYVDNLCFSYLSQGCSIQMLAWAFRMGKSTVRQIVLETCQIIWEELHAVYLSTPNAYEYKLVAERFYIKTGMPNCVGAIDGKHVNIFCPPNAGSEFYNYKGHHSIVLLACCDDRYCFTMVDIGALGSQSDGGIFSESLFGKEILNETIQLPQSTVLPESNIQFPYYFVADAAFPLKRNIMRPYPGKNLERSREVFNYKLSSARRYIENTFGILCARWRILLNNINCHPKNVDKIIKAVVVLHNFVNLNDKLYCPGNFVDHYENGVLIEGLWRQESDNLPSCGLGPIRNSKRENFTLRDTLKDYLFGSLGKE